MCRSVGMVLQDTWLKTETIRDKIVMKKPDALDEAMIAAGKRGFDEQLYRSQFAHEREESTEEMFV